MRKVSYFFLGFVLPGFSIYFLVARIDPGKILAVAIPIIDLFAGPGGLGEGFASLSDDKSGSRNYRIKLSIEMDPVAHRTLLLRSFFRQFKLGGVPNSYYQYLREEISLEELFSENKRKHKAAQNEAWNAELGKVSNRGVDRRIRAALGQRTRRWLLIGGPPCQAYSVIGRAKMRNREGFKHDDRYFLYREYLRIVAKHQPAVFVMENVRGILSSRVRGEKIFPKILEDLSRPCQSAGVRSKNPPTYRLVSVVDEVDASMEGQPASFLIKAEDHGVPQSRHRVFVIGIRNDIRASPVSLPSSKAPKLWNVISDLPKLRGGLSKKGGENHEDWLAVVRSSLKMKWFRELPPKLRKKISGIVSGIGKNQGRGGEFLKTRRRKGPDFGDGWFLDSRIGGVCNHSTRAHIRKDIHRYLFASAFAAVNERSPLLKDIPKTLQPLHRNRASGKFQDRFRVQLRNNPSTTITSHISRDGHYYIHPDPAQIRSLTVREAARLQTFPDNYFFEGFRTKQYHQVGNAVPPYLARQLAECLLPVFQRPQTSDVFTKSKRSEVMSKIRGSGNKSTELALIKIFRENGITGWRRNYPLFGKPDFVFPEYGVAVFVDGCFWHGCPRHGNIPKNNREFWRNKIEGNKKRDRRVSRKLRSEGWLVCRIWECRLSGEEAVVGRIGRLME